MVIERGSEMDINEKISVENVDTTIFKRKHCEVPVPTEIVITGQPAVYAPQQARYYPLSLWEYKGELLSYSELAALPQFRGTSHYDKAMLVEVWENYGSDGHVMYQHVGYRLVLQSRLMADIKNRGTAPEMPACMRDGAF